MKVVTLTTVLDAPPDKVWQELQKPQLLQYVAHPVLQFDAVAPDHFPQVWQEGEYIVSLKWRRFIPFGRQVIRISHTANSDGVRQLRDNGSSAMIKRWDHLITVEPKGEGTRYTDQVTVDAGILTFAVAMFARSFYRHRQRRWHKLVKSGFDYSEV